MQLNISGHHMNNGSALEAYISKQMQEHVEKYFSNAVSADVMLLKEKHDFKTTIVINEGTGKKVFIKGTGESDDVYKSFHVAMEHALKQLRRFKRKLNHNKRSGSGLD